MGRGPQNRRNDQRDMDSSRRIPIIIGLLLSLWIGFQDVTLSLFSGPYGLTSFPSLLAPLAATITAVLLIYGVLWVLFVSNLELFLNLEAVPLAVALASFLGINFTFASSDLIKFSESPTRPLELLIVLSTSLLVSVGAYFVARTAGRMPQYRSAASALCLAAPFVFGATLLFVWLWVYGAQSMGLMASLVVALCYGATAVFTLCLSFRIGLHVRMTGYLAVWVILFIGSPFGAWLSTRGPEARFDGFKESDHRIKRVILITVDTLRADALSSYDSQAGPTPHIDQLARDGIVFTKAFSASPWTLPSMASIMTGLPPSVHMATGRQSRLSDNLRTLAESMRDAGYFTVGVGLNSYLGPQFNMSQGFLEYDFFPKSMGTSFGATLLKVMLPGSFGRAVTTHELTQIASDWVRSNSERNFFLWLHYFDPHDPYSPPKSFLPPQEPPAAIGPSFSKIEETRAGYFVPTLAERAWISDLYGGEVRYVDETVGEFLEVLRCANLYEDSLVIFTSDHGEEFWDHSGHGHGHTLYNELLQVPLIIKLPRSVSINRISNPVSTQRIMPTILNLVGLDAEERTNHSASLSPLWGPEGETLVQGPIFGRGLLFYEDRESVIFEGFKYIRSLLANHEELYDLARDPQEQNSLIASAPQKVERAKEILREHQRQSNRLREHYGTTSEDQVKLDKETIEHLKSLGYIR